MARPNAVSPRTENKPKGAPSAEGVQRPPSREGRRLRGWQRPEPRRAWHSHGYPGGSHRATSASPSHNSPTGQLLSPQPLITTSGGCEVLVPGSHWPCPLPRPEARSAPLPLGAQPVPARGGARLVARRIDFPRRGGRFNSAGSRGAWAPSELGAGPTLQRLRSCLGRTYGNTVFIHTSKGDFQTSQNKLQSSKRWAPATFKALWTPACTYMEMEIFWKNIKLRRHFLMSCGSGGRCVLIVWVSCLIKCILLYIKSQYKWTENNFKVTSNLPVPKGSIFSWSRVFRTF